jgi:hypothetical protein
MRYYTISWSLAALLPFTVLGQAQQGSGSPYSAYGFGELLGSTQVVRASMAGVGIATFDPFGVDVSNPASLASLARPVFEAGLAQRFMQLSTSTQRADGRRTDLLGLSLGVPFGNGKWGLALGVQPFTDVGYEVATQAPLDGGPDEVEYIYSGDGGLNRAYIGFARAIQGARDSLGHGRRLNIGVAMNYLFGRVDETRKAIYPEAGSYHSSLRSTLFVHDALFTTGLQFQGDLIKRKNKEERGLRYMVGAAVEVGGAMRAERSELATSFYFSGSGVELTYDTALYIASVASAVDLPASIGVGFGVHNLNWNISVEHRSRQWSALNAGSNTTLQRGRLGDQAQTALGASYRPAGEVGGAFWQRTIYRVGLRYLQDYLVVRDRQLSEFGVSMGVSLPVMGSSTRSRLNIGAEFGERGTLTDGLLKERFADVYIGISITPDLREQWFKKRRID